MMNLTALYKKYNAFQTPKELDLMTLLTYVERKRALKMLTWLFYGVTTKAPC
jgi:hypothetical protein